jgi:serine/threonine-protein kinase
MSMGDTEFLRAIHEKGWATAAQIDECRKAQELSRAQTGVTVAIAEILAAKGYVSREQIAQLQGAKGYSFGPYWIERKIGEGGMGAVYLARREGAETPVALKILPQKFSEDESHVARFQREAMISIRLTHPNLVKGHEYGQAKGRWYYAMEFVQGRTVSALIKEKKVLDEKEAAGIALQVARALGEIHRHGLVHRDIKPDNVMIDAHGGARVMDLGLIKSFATEHTRLTQTGYALGTLHYMSPEQLQGSRGPGVDGRSDLFSLGAMLYHMVSGQIPFTGDSMVEIMDKQLKHELEPPRKFRPGLSDGICRVIEKLMAPDPADRYPAAAAVEDDLNLILQGKQPRARLIRRARKPEPARPKRIGLAVGAGIGALGAGLVAAIVLLSGGNPPPALPRPPDRPKPVDRFPGLLSQAEAAAQAKEWSKALAAIEEALKLRPGDAQAAEIKSRVEREQEYESALAWAGQFIAIRDWAKAESAAGEALGLKPGDSAALELRSKAEEGRRAESYRQAMTLAETCLQDREWAQAREACRQALQVRPGDEPARKLLDRIASEECASIVARAETLLKDKEWDKALQEADRALAVKPGDPPTEQLKKRVEQGKVDHLVKNLLAGADAALAVRTWDEARDACKKALVFKPGDAAILDRLKKIDDARYADTLARAEAYFKAREWSSALSAADEALSIRPADPAALQLKKKIEVAAPAAMYEEAMGRAEKLRASKEWPGALAAADEALKARPGDAAAQKLKERIRLEMGEGGYKAAIKRGDEHMKNKEWDQAAAAYAEALEARPGDAKAKAALSRAKEYLGGDAKEFENLLLKIDAGQPAQRLGLSSDGRIVAFFGSQTLEVYSTQSGQKLQSLKATLPVALKFSPAGGVLAAADDRVILFDTTTWREIKRLGPFSSYVYGLAFSRDGKRLAVAPFGATVRVYDAQTWVPLVEFPEKGKVSHLELGPDGRHLVTMEEGNRNPTIWTVGPPPTELWSDKRDWVSPAFSPDGTKVIAVIEDQITVLETATGKELNTLSAGRVQHCVMSPNGKWVAVTEGKHVKLWDVDSGAELARLNHSDKVDTVVFSGDGRRLASVGMDRAIRVWGRPPGLEQIRPK